MFYLAKIFFLILFKGPYVCAEHDFGALPWWLLSNGTDSIRPRTKEHNYMSAVKRWFNVLLPKISPHLYKNGGKIITVQVRADLSVVSVLFYNHDLKKKKLKYRLKTNMDISTHVIRII